MIVMKIPNPESGPKVGFIGTGWTERVQIPAFRLGGLQAHAICSGNPENATRVAKQLEIPHVFQDWRQLIESPEVEVVSIVTPPNLHAEMAIAALAAGKHVICEKPVALNTKEAEQMLAAAQAAPNQLAIIDHELRFHPLRQKVRSLVRDNGLGALLHFDLHWSSPHRLNRNAPYSWHSDADTGGGILGALGSHLLDKARWLVGRVDALSASLVTGHLVREVSSTGRKRNVTSDDRASIQLRFAGGLRGLLTASAIDPGPPGMELQIVGTAGAAKIDREDRLWVKIGENYFEQDWHEVKPENPVAEFDAFAGVNPFAKGSIYLAQALKQALHSDAGHIPEAATFYDGLVVQRLLDAARRSNVEQSWVQL